MKSASHRQRRIGLIQQQCWNDKQQSLAQTEQQLDALVAQAQPDIVLLQELHGTQYFCQTADPNLFDLAEPIDGPTAQRLAQLAQQHGIVLIGSIFERRAPGVYHNTALVFDSDGSLAGCYRKMHIPDDPGFYEKFYFTRGDQGFEPIDTSAGRLGVLVCWDQWYPEAARLMAMAGAEILFYPTAIGWDPMDTDEEQLRQQQAWQIIQRSHAVANHLPVVAANRVGFEADPSGASEGIQFWGHSFICGPQGELLTQGSSDDPEVLWADVNLDRTETLRRIWPYFRDRRIDAYQDLNLRFREPSTCS